MIKRRYFILLSMLILLVSYKPAGVNWKIIEATIVAKELKDLQLSYSKINNYSVRITYLTYDTKKGSDVRDRSTGYMIKSGLYTKSSLLGIYSVQNQKLRVTIDSSKKKIHVSNAFPFKDPGLSFNDYVKILGLCKSIKKVVNDDHFGYRFETKNTQGLVAQEVYIKNGITREVNVYYANEHFYRENNNIQKEIVYPRLQVLFSDFNPKIVVNPEDFSVSNIIEIDRNNKLKLQANYLGYKLIDGRVKK
jgi:hypothetical protein